MMPTRDDTYPLWNLPVMISTRNDTYLLWYLPVMISTRYDIYPLWYLPIGFSFIILVCNMLMKLNKMRLQQKYV
jgi:hypothetical protein